MCQSAVAGMNGSSSRPQRASMRSSARADVSALELQVSANKYIRAPSPHTLLRNRTAAAPAFVGPDNQNPS